MYRYRIITLGVSFLVLCVCCVGVLYLVFSQRTALNALATKVDILEEQVTLLGDALKESNAISTANKHHIQEMENRRDVIAESQDEQLTTAVANATPGVVSIVVSKDVPLLEVEYVNPFGDDPYFQDVGFRVPTYRQVGTESRQIGAGTGFIVRSDGYIVTNRHVIDERDADYTVLLSNGEQLPARVIYRDVNYDLAVLKISAQNLPTLTLGDSSTLRLGQTVVAIGNALGEYNNSVSVGIISGLERTIDAQDASGRIETLSGVIQTDAAINSGNSGGPLLDLEGRVVGMNVAVDQYANAIAFSIPINDIKPIIERVLE